MLKLRLVHPGVDKGMGATYYFVMATIFNWHLYSRCKRMSGNKA